MNSKEVISDFLFSLDNVDCDNETAVDRDLFRSLIYDEFRTYNKDTKEYEDITEINGFKFEFVDMDGHQHDGQEFGYIFKINDVLVKIPCFYSSWGSNTIDIDDMFLVKAVEQTITVYEAI